MNKFLFVVFSVVVVDGVIVVWIDSGLVGFFEIWFLGFYGCLLLYLFGWYLNILVFVLEELLELIWVGLVGL